MNVFLWILQTLLAIHTVIGALWKFSKSAEQTMPSLKTIPGGVWQTMACLEILVGLLFFLPALYKPFRVMVPLAAGLIVLEMLLFSALQMLSGDANYGPVVYWLVIAGLSGFVSYCRLVIKPL